MGKGTERLLKHLGETYGVSYKETESLLDDAMYDYDVVTAILNCIAKSLKGD